MAESRRHVRRQVPDDRRGAATMRVSKMTVYRLVHNGDLPAVRVGRSFRVTEDDVNEYLQELLQRRLIAKSNGPLGTGHRFAGPSLCRIGCRVPGPGPGATSSALEGSTWVLSSRSGASAWRRRSTASCSRRRASSVASSASSPLPRSPAQGGQLGAGRPRHRGLPRPRSALRARLAADPGIDRVIGVDVVPPRGDVGDVLRPGRHPQPR